MQGKPQNKKNLTEIMVAHGIPYVAQTTFLGNMRDLHEKSHRAIYTPGAAFLNVLSPCPRGWRYPAADIAAVVKAAVDSCVWPLFEVVEGVYHLTYEPRRKIARGRLYAHAGPLCPLLQARQRVDARSGPAMGGSAVERTAGKMRIKQASCRSPQWAPAFFPRFLSFPAAGFMV